MFKHLVAVVVLIMFGGLAWRFGSEWTPGIWAVLIIAFLLYALTLVNPKIAKDLIAKLPAILGKVNPFVKKEKNDDGKPKE